MTVRRLSPIAAGSRKAIRLNPPAEVAAAFAALAASRGVSASALAEQLVTAAALSGEVAVAASSYTAIPGQT